METDVELNDVFWFNNVGKQSSETAISVNMSQYVTSIYNTSQLKG